MPISKVLSYVPIDRLLLDQLNPRLGRDKRKAKLDQAQLLTEMSSWTLDELVDSFAQADGFWTQDALIVIRDTQSSGDDVDFIVVEGNRRLAALKLLYKAIKGEGEPPRWLQDRLKAYSPDRSDDIFQRLPVLVADQREDVSAYLGFRHVTGIKQWRPAEKAEFIVALVDEQKLSYREVARQIGSRTDAVRQNYLAFKMLLQMEEMEGFDWSEVEERFSLLFLSIRSEGTREFLGVENKGELPTTDKPIPDDKKENTRSFAGWLFGSKVAKGIVRDSRNVDKFGEILGEPRAVEYLRTAEKPDFETAYSLTASADLVIDPLGEAARHLRLALSEIGRRGEEPAVREAAWPVVEGGIKLAISNKGENLRRAKEMLVAA